VEQERVVELRVGAAERQWPSTRALMETETRQLAISRVFDAPRELVYRAFTDPDHLAKWWGPMGNSLPREEIDFDVRPGGYQRWTEVSANEPDLRQWLPPHLAGPSEQGWLEAFTKLDATLTSAQIAADREGVVA
jgi:uncharacterized protein YndB with AHSA1/START domain